MCHVFPYFREKPAFPTRDAPIDKRNLFLSSGRMVFRCMHKRNLFLPSGRVVFRCTHKSLQKKVVPNDRKNNFKVLIICENKFQNPNLVNFFVVSVHFYYFTFCFKFYFPIADIIVSHLYLLFA